MNTEKLIDRYVKGGGNRERGIELLAELMAAHDGVNLKYALNYWGFTR